MVPMAHAQLHLIEIEEEQWKLDERTILVGRKGLATARAALARSARPFVTTGDEHQIAA